jgi:protein-tyrosine phosphatase
LIDLHSHVLPGLDDGAHDLGESLEILTAMAAEGVEVVVATPHVREDYPTSPSAMRDALHDVRAAVGATGLSIQVLPGGELSVAVVDASSADQLAAFGLGGNQRLVLIEFPYGDWPPFIERRIERLRGLGITPVLAHPERNDRVIAEPSRLTEVVGAGAIVQLTAASIDGRHGRRVARSARELLALGLAHVVASDAHAPAVRAAGLRSALAALDDPRLARWLVDDVPSALLSGSELPARPVRRGRSFRRVRIRRS